ncbi:MAG: glycosyltransferase 87 family protein, partial [Burkholderiaceae bacterium]|nr:glycosyltransferase 87 family protein [Burkholderiaceae bacterium]
MNRKIFDVFVYVSCLAFCLAFTWYAGCDYNWDLRNYYLYAPHAYVNGLLGKDFMAGSFQSYLNPLPYVPFYLMVRAGWPSLLIGMVLAGVHALNLCLLWPICKRLMEVADDTLWGRRLLALLCLVLGVSGVMFLVEVGSTYTDVSTSVLVLGGVLLLLKGVDEPERLLRYTFLAGLLLGAATGLKLTNTPYALAAGVFGLVPGLRLARRAKFYLMLGAGGLVGAVLSTGQWCWLLYREYGSPFFPFFNGLFQAPDFIPATYRHARFLQASLLDALMLPFSIIETYEWTYVEISAPEVRFAAFFGACALLVIAAVLRKWWPALRTRMGTQVMAAKQQMFVAYVVVGWVVWMVMFSNGRYLLPLTLLIGAACGVVLWRLLPAR